MHFRYDKKFLGSHKQIMGGLFQKMGGKAMGKLEKCIEWKGKLVVTDSSDTTPTVKISTCNDKENARSFEATTETRYF